MGYLRNLWELVSRDSFFWAMLVAILIVAWVPIESYGGKATYGLSLLVMGIVAAALNSHRFFQRHENLLYFIVYSSISFIFIVAFAMAYAEYGMKIEGGPSYSIDDALYLSVITWTTIGYGDISPLGEGRNYAMIEGLISHVYMALLIAKIITLINPRARQENDPA